MSELKSSSKSPLLTVLTSPVFWLALLIYVLSTISRAMLRQPVTLMAADLGLPAAVIGFLASLYTICAMLIRTPFGAAIDNSKNPAFVLALSNFFMAAVFVGFGLCNSTVFFVVLRALHGFCFGMAHMGMLVVVGCCIDKKALGSAFGLFTLLPKIANAYTTKLALAMQQAAGIERCAYIGAALAVACGILCLFLKMPVRTVEQSDTAKAPKKGLFGKIYLRAVPSAIIMVLIQLTSLSVDNVGVLLGEEMGVSTLAADYVSRYSLWMGIGIFILGYISDVVSIAQRKLILYSSILFAIIAQVMICFSQQPSMWYISSILCGLGAGGAMVARAIAMKESSPKVAAMAVATFAMMQDVGTILVSTFAGVIAQFSSYQTLFVVFLAGPVIAFVALALFFDRLIKYMDAA